MFSLDRHHIVGHVEFIFDTFGRYMRFVNYSTLP